MLKRIWCQAKSPIRACDAQVVHHSVPTEMWRPSVGLRGEVTSPGGTTAAAMHVLEEGGFRALIENAIRAAAQRSRDLGARAQGDLSA